jgi:mRNA-degrading endonuclease HigB of HigAB toxin-antitoxin module
VVADRIKRSHYGNVVESFLDVKAKAPIMGSMLMRFVGLTDLRDFLTVEPRHTETLVTWLFEIRHRTWKSIEALEADFPNLENSHGRLVIFNLVSANIQIETLIDFRNQIVLLTAIRSPSAS